MDGGPAAVTLHAHGEFDIVNAQTLALALQDACANFLHVVLDVSDVSFIDAYALRGLAAARERASRLGHGLSVVGARGSVRRVIDLTGLSESIPAQRV